MTARATATPALPVPLRAEWRLEDVARVVGGRLQPPSAHGTTARGVSTDTRTIRRGEIFFALRGPRFDGHAFAAEAFARGAAAVVADHALDVGGPVIVVADVVRALGDLAAAYRMAIPARVVAVTGSVGKTTTKDMIAHVLSHQGRTVRAPASYNNHIGVPLTVLSADPETEYLVVEAGISRPGDMDHLAAILRPDVAVCTTVAESHLEGLGAVDAVAREKGRLFDFMRAGGTAVRNADNPWTRRMRPPESVAVVEFGVLRPCEFQVRAAHGRNGWISFILRDIPFKIPAPSLSFATNAAAAAAACWALGVAVEECAARLRSFVPPPMRMEVSMRGEIRFVNDAYNANPASVRAALAAFVRAPCRGRRIAVLGDMKELGPQSQRLHDEVVRFAASLRGLHGLLLVGPLMSRAAVHAVGRTDWLDVEDAAAAARWLRLWARPGDAVLLKASRAVRLETVLESFPPAED
jgi:UDP-N-acetylmuramoyl-tripeptide--D-alanyl-D-alanine ligase